ncbi:hypothetical protein D3C72_50220 [compost metagenome]
MTNHFRITTSKTGAFNSRKKSDLRCSLCCRDIACEIHNDFFVSADFLVARFGDVDPPQNPALRIILYFEKIQ